MSRATVILNGSTERAKAVNWINRAPPGTSVTFKRNKRTLDQNSLLWALLTEVSQQVTWHGQKLAPEDWKDMFTASLRKARVVPGIDPGSFVVLGLHTSDMDKEEMSNLIELILAFGAEHGVTFQSHLTREAA
jgi:hypothetical protein